MHKGPIIKQVANGNKQKSTSLKEISVPRDSSWLLYCQDSATNLAGEHRKSGILPPLLCPQFSNASQYGVPNRVLLRGVNFGVETLGDKVECYKELSKWSSKQLGYKLSVDIHSDDRNSWLLIHMM